MASIPHKQDTTNTRARYQTSQGQQSQLSETSSKNVWDLTQMHETLSCNYTKMLILRSQLLSCEDKLCLTPVPRRTRNELCFNKGYMSTSSGLRERSSERHWAVERTELVWDYMHVCLMTSLFIGACALIRVWSYRCVSRVAKMLAHISQAKREVHTTSPSRPLWICP